MSDLLHLVAHPALLGVAALIALWVLPGLARFFFGSFAEFKSELNLGDDFGAELGWLGFLPNSPGLYFKVVGFLGCYGLAVLLLYSLLVHLTGRVSP